MTPFAASPGVRGRVGALSILVSSGVAVVSVAAASLAAVSLAAGTGAAASTPSAPPAIRSEGPAVVKARTAALLMSEMSGGEIRTSVLALPGTPPSGDHGAGERESGETPQPVWVKVEIDAGGFLGPEQRGGDDAAPEGLQGSVPVEVFLYALGSDGEILDAFTLRFALGAAERRELLAGRGLAVAATLELPPGEIRLRHLVWSEVPRSGQRFGLGTTTVTVRTGELPAALWIPERSDRWIRVGRQGEGVPAWWPGEPVPASLPVLETGEATSRQVVTWRRVGTTETETETGFGSRTKAPLEASLAGVIRLQPDGAGEPGDLAAGSVPAEVPYEVLERRTEPAGGELVRVAFPVPAVAPGRYRLILRPRQGEAPPALPVVVASPGGGGIWPAVLPALPDSPELSSPEDEILPAVPEPPAAGKRTLVREGTETGPGEGVSRYLQPYRKVIARLAGGDPEGAAVDLVRLEAGVLEDLQDGDPEWALSELVEVQRETAAELLGPGADGALALALLHAEAARRHVRATRWLLADRAVEQAVWLAEGHAAVRGSREARRDAAGLLAWLAADLRQAGRGSKARVLFQRSLDLEETDGALLGLATLAERSGGISEAVAALERLVERDPSHREARLRLAINLVRVGRLEPARDLLRRLVRTADTSWVAAVAFQELARIDLDRGDCAGAVRELRRALDRFPQEPQLAVQLAWALECAGETGASREAAARIVERARRGETGGECPRTRYTRWSPAVLAPERERLGELARESRQALAVRLGELGAGS